MVIDKLQILYVLIFTNIATWMLCRIWFDDILKNEIKEKRKYLDRVSDLIVQIDNLDKVKNELSCKNYRQEVEIEKLNKEIERTNEVNKQLRANYDSLVSKLKECELYAEKVNAEKLKLENDLQNEQAKNKTLFQALQTANEMNRILFLESENESLPAYSGEPDFDAVSDSGTNYEEIEAMIQVMQGRTISRKVKADAVQGIQKMQGTCLYDELVDRIEGAKQRIEEALLSEEQEDSSISDDDLAHFDIMKYVT